jgi:small-conductance mechanosensitive channel
MKFEASLRRFWEQNDEWQWLLAVVTASLLLLVTLIARRWVRGRHGALAATEQIEFMELPLGVASKTSVLFLVSLSVFGALSSLNLPPGLWRIAKTAFTIVAFFQLGVWLSAAVRAWVVGRHRSASGEDRASVGSLGIVGFLLRMVVWTLIVLLTLENLGVDITALVAGLGIGGVAVALALQNVLGDLFASLSITLDRPFVIGDFIVVGDYLGTVEQIGIKSTRLRSLGGEQIVMSNADLLGSRVRNYGRMKERRVVFSLGVTYETPREKLKRTPEMIRRCVERQEGTRFDRCHFSKYGDFALEFESVYFVASPDYNQYMDRQQAIYLDVHEAFEREQIEFAYPTQKLWIAQEAPPGGFPASG